MTPVESDLGTNNTLSAGEIVFSVFTCTWNREDILHRVYESLAGQTFRQFEWVVFDNGSTDSTAALVKQWEGEATFPIRYYSRPENSSIQTAYNEGVKHSRGRFWLMLDSDDACVPSALERFYALWQDIPESERNRFVGVTVNCVDQHGRFVGSPFPESPLDSTPQESTWKFGVAGEKWGFQRVEVLREFPFQDDPHHIQPGAIWRAIGRRYKTRYVNESLRIYYIDEPNRHDQLSRHSSMDDSNSVGQRINNLDVLNNEMHWFRHSPIEFFKCAAIYSRYCDKLGYSLGKQFSDISKFSGKALLAVSLIFKVAHTASLKFRLWLHEKTTKI